MGGPPGARRFTRSNDQTAANLLTAHTVLDYAGLARADTGGALQAAQRTAMTEFPHPFAWAAFGLTGVGH